MQLNVLTMKCLSTILFVFFAFYLHGQIVDIPDANFKQTLIDLGVDTNNNNDIEESEALELTALSVFQKSIVSLKGIGKFTNLRSFTFSKNFVATVDLSDLINLEVIAGSENLLTNIIYPSSENLRIVNVRDNRLNDLVFGDVPNLSFLNYSQNPIEDLDLSAYTNLESLFCFNCLLTDIDLSQNTKLEELIVNDNVLNNLNLNTTIQLKRLNCSSNKFGVLDLSNLVNLIQLDCDDNQLEVLDLSNNIVLEELYCDRNNIQNLDCSFSNVFSILFCQENDIRRLNIKNGNDEIALDFSLNPNLSFICADSTQIPTVTVLASNSNYTNLAISTDCSTVVSSESIEDLSSDIELFPNPTFGSVTINSNIGFNEIWIRTTEGELMKSKKFDQAIFSHEIIMENFPSQMYIIGVNQGDHIVHYKLLKQ